MIVETSAVIAVLRAEPLAESLLRTIARAETRRLSAASYVEIGAVIDRAGDPVASRRVDQFLDEASIEIVAVTPDQARIARQAYRDFCKGSGHRAQLDLGDCFAYALAVESGEPLLFVGEDFSHTDVERA